MEYDNDMRWRAKQNNKSKLNKLKRHIRSHQQRRTSSQFLVQKHKNKEKDNLKNQKSYQLNAELTTPAQSGKKPMTKN